MLADPMVFRARVLLARAAVGCAIAFLFPAAQSVSQLGRGSPLRAELLDAARSTFEAETNGPIEFVVRRLNLSGDWAIGDVRLQRPGGSQLNWNKTKYGADFAAGMFDPGESFFLLSRSAGTCGWLAGGPPAAGNAV